MTGSYVVQLATIVLRGTNGPRQGKLALDGPQGLLKHGRGRLEELPADIANYSVLNVVQNVYKTIENK